METLQIGAITKQVPSTWNEMTRKQLLRVLAELYGASETNGYRLRLLAILTGFRLPLLSALAPDVLAQLLPLVDFTTSEDHRLTAQLVPTLRLPGRHRTEPATTVHGPRASLSNATFGEFIFADTFFIQYHRAKAQHRATYLDKFLAVLYRPAKRHVDPEAADWNGDVRIPFNEYHLEQRTPRLAPVPALEKLAVLTWYRGCRAQLGLEFPEVFAAAEEIHGPAKAPEWDRVLRKLSGGAFGTVGETAGQPLRLVLAEMHDAAVEYNRLKTQKPSF
ncbi:hypothetical protein MUN81_10510 [Hymenobacter sp. 5317J-9]|uniref:hypothetical protein n=1 Tax=Hymenobacter sp. 5317J-9 TaxID=2932250 RepID=UPI001FD637E0|nr:hypothetical protein [Hymenobacter sp. 5317J-9]UOQ99911.1 hypothetical protein MUN81_10510 [Hymenobacter sp. 5317J-9]